MELKNLRLLGGKLCIDFANSFDNVGPGQRLDFIGSYEDFVRWSRHVELLSAANARELDQLAAEHEDEAGAVYRRALELRAALRDVLGQIAVGAVVSPDALTVIEQEYQRAVAAIHLTPDHGRFEWDWQTTAAQLDQPLWPLALSAVDLLTGGETRRVKLCASHGCGWLFYDQSKNRSRRWCSMEGCGSQDKMRRHYRKRKQATERAQPRDKARPPAPTA